MPARTFQLPSPRPWPSFGPLVTLVAGLTFAAAASASTEHPGDGFWAGAALTALVAAGSLLLVHGGRLRDRRGPPRRSVDVGADGVLVGDRFIPYTDVTRVRHGRRARIVARPSRGDGEIEETLHEWVVCLELNEERKGGILLAGESVEVVTRHSHADSGDPLGDDLARAIADALAAWTEARRDEDIEVGVARGGRTGAAWLDALRRLGSGAAGSYREAAADVEKLSRLLDDPHELPSARAAAAVVLAASGDETARSRLRIAAGAVVDPRVRVALESVADETAVAEALEALDEADRALAARGRARRSAARA